MCPCLCGTVCHCQTQNNLLFEAKITRQLFNVANIKYRFLSDSVRFLNKFRKFIQHRIEYLKSFSLLDTR